jgi:antitoxin component HigA of HigAB toxin-antitoxin module
MSFLQIHNEQSYCDALERTSQFFDDPPQMNSQEAENFKRCLAQLRTMS